MKILSVREFQKNANRSLRSKDPILVMRRKLLVGVFFPCPEASLSLEVKRDVFAVVSAEIARWRRKRGLGEQDIQNDFQAWRFNKCNNAGRHP